MKNFGARSAGGGLVEEPEDAAIGRADASGWVCAGARIRFGAQGGEDWALIFSGYQEIGVAAGIQDRERERQAVRRHGCDLNGHDPAGSFLRAQRNPGNSEAVWPSGPRPSSVTSNAGADEPKNFRNS